MKGLIYHPFTPCDTQFPLTVGLSWTIICVLGGYIGVAFELNSPWSWAYPDSFRFMRDFRSKLSVRLAYGRSQHHICSKKSLWILDNPEMKCYLKFQIARSAEFLRWMWGGTNWNFSFISLIKVLITLVHRAVPQNFYEGSKWEISVSPSPHPSQKFSRTGHPEF